MDLAAATPQRQLPIRAWLGIAWRLVIACLLGAIAFIPYDISVFFPGIQSVFYGYFIWYGPQLHLEIGVQYVLFAEAAFAVLMLVSLLVDRRIPRRWQSLVGASLLLVALLLALLSLLLVQDLVNLVFLAGFSRGLGGIPIFVDFYPFFFAAIAAAFILGERPPAMPEWRQTGFFILVGIVAVAGCAMIHTLLLLLTYGQDQGINIFLADFFLLPAPLLLLMAVLGGLFGGYLRVGLVRLFAAQEVPAAPEQAQTEAASEQAHETPPAQAARPARRIWKVWGILWRLAIAGAVGALLGRGTVRLSIWFSLNSIRQPLFVNPSTTSILLGLLPLALFLVGLLLQRELWHGGAIGWSLGAILLLCLLVIGTIDIPQSAFNSWFEYYQLQHQNQTYPDTIIQIDYTEDLLGVLALAIVMACALGGRQAVSSRKKRWLLCASIGVIFFLGTLIQTIQTQLQPPLWPALAALKPSSGFLTIYVIVGVVIAALGGLLGGWLRPKAMQWIARLRG